MLVPAARERLARREAGEQVAVAVALVDHHPRRHVADAGRLTLVDLVHGLDVGERLVHEAAAVGVDDDRAGQVALGQAEPRAVGQRDGRAPPGVVEQGGLGAGGDAREQALAGVELRGGGPVDGGRLGLVLLAELEVLLEPTAAEHHAAAGPDDVLGRLVCTRTPTTRPSSISEPGQVAAVDDGDVRVGQPLAQADRDRVAHRDTSSCRAAA